MLLSTDPTWSRLIYKFIPTLSEDNPQTRAMIIRTMGFCARLNKPVARDVIAYVEKHIDHKESLTLAGSINLFLGDVGAISKEDAQIVFSLFERSVQSIFMNEQDSLLEALFRIFSNLDSTERGICFGQSPITGRNISQRGIEIDSFHSLQCWNGTILWIDFTS